MFDEIIAAAPHLAEGWNKRATAYYQRGDYRASLADIAETLRREPRHFGALWGQADMLRQLGEYVVNAKFDRKAGSAFRDSDNRTSFRVVRR